LSEPRIGPPYQRPPITEAVIQIRMAADVELRLLDKIAKRLKKNYPNAQPMQGVQVTLDDTGRNVGVTQNAEGFRLASDDQTDILLVNKRGVTAARLPPYPGWDVLRNNAKAAWEVWKDVTPSHPIERLGVRYINRIDIPLDETPLVKVEQYLHFHPKIDAITQAPMLGFMLQVAIPTRNPKWTATITSTPLGPTQVPNHFSIILDIDVARIIDIPTRDETLWPIIEEARAEKDDLFERCITDDSRRLFSL
jgi:uncharacterized protein (TIGR04255 family)